MVREYIKRPVKWDGLEDYIINNFTEQISQNGISQNGAVCIEDSDQLQNIVQSICRDCEVRSFQWCEYMAYSFL